MWEIDHYHPYTTSSAVTSGQHATCLAARQLKIMSSIAMHAVSAKAIYRVLSFTPSAPLLDLPQQFITTHMVFISYIKSCVCFNSPTFQRLVGRGGGGGGEKSKQNPLQLFFEVMGTSLPVLHSGASLAEIVPVHLHELHAENLDK